MVREWRARGARVARAGELGRASSLPVVHEWCASGTRALVASVGPLPYVWCASGARVVRVLVASVGPLPLPLLFSKVRVWCARALVASVGPLPLPLLFSKVRACVSGLGRTSSPACSASGARVR